MENMTAQFESMLGGLEELTPEDLDGIQSEQGANLGSIFSNMFGGNKKEEPVVFILWGNFAKEKAKFITNTNHLIIASPHPSPFSARSGFFGSHPFSKTNNYLKSHNIKEIDWNLNK